MTAQVFDFYKYVDNKKIQCKNKSKLDILRQSPLAYAIDEMSPEALELTLEAFDVEKYLNNEY